MRIGGHSRRGLHGTWLVASAVVAMVLALSAVALIGPAQGLRAAQAQSSTLATTETALDVVNQYRADAKLPPVSDSAEWSNGAALHSKYMVKNSEITHTEDPAKPFYTLEGKYAGANGNVSVASYTSRTDRDFVESWITGPFHAIGIFDPRLQVTGYGTYFEETAPKWKSGATLDVLRGRTGAGNTAPVVFPANGRVVPIGEYGGYEHPDPLSSCSGYTAPSGLPIIVQLPEAKSVISDVKSALVDENGQPLEHCRYASNSYTNPNASDQSRARSILDSRNAIVIVPKLPLAQGQTYGVQVKTCDFQAGIDSRFAIGPEDTPVKQVGLPTAPAPSSCPAPPPPTSDTASPTGSVLINGGRASTTSRTVSLRLRASDPSPGSGVSSMRVKNAGGTWSGWQAIATPKSWNLTRGGGKKTVYVQYRDRAGNVSAAARDSITYRP